MQLTRVEPQTHIECIGTRALSEPIDKVVHHHRLSH